MSTTEIQQVTTETTQVSTSWNKKIRDSFTAIGSALGAVIGFVGGSEFAQTANSVETEFLLRFGPPLLLVAGVIGMRMWLEKKGIFPKTGTKE